MRKILALPLLLAAACGVDSNNDTVTINYDSEAIENTAGELGNAAEQAASDISNVAGAIENRVDDIDVDIDLNRNESTNAT